jgi:hypothetical protein
VNNGMFFNVAGRESSCRWKARGKSNASES